MWNTISFRSCPDAFFQYKFDGDMFMIKCELYSPSLSGGRVCVHSKGERCHLGSLKGDSGFLLLEKTYPISFLHSNGIDKEAITHFSIETQDGDIILSYPLNGFGSALDDAQRILDKMKGAPSKDKAEEIINEIKRKLYSLPKEAMPFLKDFEWHRVDDKSEKLSPSAIRHIVLSPPFMQNFENSGYWLFGFNEKNNTFAICIKSDAQLPNPMENALDCCVSFDMEKDRYYVVGIGLYDDGQYFVRL